MSGIVQLSGTKFVEWADDSDIFIEDFKLIAKHFSGRSAESDFRTNQYLGPTYSWWIRQNSIWANGAMKNSDKGLSQLKLGANLLWAIKLKEPFVATAKVDKTNIAPDTPGLFDARDNQNFAAHPSILIGWTVVHTICSIIEKRRTDRLTPYVDRVTTEYESDLLTWLTNSNPNSFDIYMSMKSLYLRASASPSNV